MVCQVGCATIGLPICHVLRCEDEGFFSSVAVNGFLVFNYFTTLSNHWWAEVCMSCGLVPPSTDKLIPRIRVDLSLTNSS